jgi:hypothetical protein
MRGLERTWAAQWRARAALGKHGAARIGWSTGSARWSATTHQREVTVQDCSRNSPQGSAGAASGLVCSNVVDAREEQRRPAFSLRLEEV